MKSKGTLIAGFITGLLVPLLSMYLIAQFRPELMVIHRFDFSEVRHLNMQLMTITMLPNAALFFVALRFENEDFGRGLISATLLLLAAVFIYRFLL